MLTGSYTFQSKPPMHRASNEVLTITVVKARVELPGNAVKA
jgi:hypothetical protein